jgi:DNA repair protein SbcC/Rad50
MRIRKIELENLNSLRGQHSVDFTQPPLDTAGIIAITGETGAGKSTLLDAILLALYGRTAREHEKEVVTYGQPEAWAEVEFEVNQVLYRCRWEVKIAKRGDKIGKQQTSEGYVKQWIDGAWQVIGSGRKELKSSKKEAGLIEQIIGLNYEQFCKSVILPQGDFAAFLNAKENDRAAILERLTNTDAYSKLGAAAYERFVSARTDHETLEIRRRELQIPSNEDIAIWNADRETGQTQLLQVQSAQKQRVTELQWYERRDILASQATQLAQQLAHLQQQKSDFEPTLSSLYAFEKLQPLLPRIKSQEEQQLAIADLTKQSHTLIGANEDRVAALSQLRSEQEAHQSKLVHIASETELLAPIVQQVGALDEQLRQEEKMLAPLLSDLQRMQSEYAALQKRISGATTEKADIDLKLAQTRVWIADNQRFGEIEADLSAIEIQLRSFETQQQAVLDLRQAAKHSVALSQTAETEIEEAQKAALSHSALITKILDAQNKSLVEAEIGRDQLNQEIQNLHALVFAYQKVQEQQERYRATLRDINTLRERHDSLQVEESVHFNELLGLFDQQSELHHVASLRQEMYEQQKRLQLVAEERSKLTPGQPCPVCGSESHPAAAHSIDLVNLAAQDYELVQTRLEVLSKQITALQYEMQEVHARMGERIIEDDAQASTELQRLLTQGKEEEEALQVHYQSILATESVVIEVANDYFDPTWPTIQPTAIQRAQDQLHHLQALRKQLDTDQVQLDALRQQQSAAQNMLSRAEATLASQQERIKAIDADLVQNQSSFDGLQLQITEKLAVYQLTIQTPPSEILAKLSAHRDTWKRGTEALGKYEQQTRDLHTSLEHLKEQELHDKSQLALKAATAEQTQQTVQTYREQRQALCGTLDVKLALQQFEDQHKTCTEQLQSALSRITELEKVNAGFLGQLEQLHSQITTRQAQLDKETSAFEAHLATENISLAALYLVQMSQDEASAVRQRKEYLEKELHTSIRQAEDIQKELEVHTKLLPTIEQTDLLEQIAELEETEQQIQRNLGSILQRFSDADKLKSQAKTLQKDLETAAKELRRWGRLNDLIGSREGDKFRRYAQGITLENLVQHANKHLHRLYGRYRIARMPNTELELEIIDTYQSDHQRSTKSLSGGETFLISLALALGLSDLAGQKTRIQSVFIDEGFGSLDAQTLDTAMEALENLQAEGVTVGIISHIPALHERIGTRVSVRKIGNGWSTIEVS